MFLEDEFVGELVLFSCNDEIIYRELIEPILKALKEIYCRTIGFSFGEAVRQFFYIIPSVLQKYDGMFSYTQRLSLHERMMFAVKMAQYFQEDIEMGVPSFETQMVFG